jgi:hypothetical protein
MFALGSQEWRLFDAWGALRRRRKLVCIHEKAKTKIAVRTRKQHGWYGVRESDCERVKKKGPADVALLQVVGPWV